MEFVKNNRLISILIGFATIIFLWALLFGKTIVSDQSSGLEGVAAGIWMLIFYIPMLIFGLIKLIRALIKHEAVRPPLTLVASLVIFFIFYLFIP